MKVGVFGGSGYSGLELLRLLSSHPNVALDFATSDRFVDRSCRSLHPALPTLIFCSVNKGVELASSCDVVFLATPAEASIALVRSLIGKTRIIDLSGAFRLQDSTQYPRAYGFTHSAPELLANACYGLVPYASTQATAQLIANPGCYATAASLALAPLASLIESDVVIDAISGTSGAGRRATEEYSFTELSDDVFAYKVLRHQHTPEIAQTLSALGGKHFSVTFVPKMGGFRRGILTTCYAKLLPNVTSAQAHAAFSGASASHANTVSQCTVTQAEDVRLRKVVGTNEVHMHLSVDSDSRRIVVVCALDNLLKGAAGQAIQNMNAAFSFPLEAGLHACTGHWP